MICFGLSAISQGTHEFQKNEVELLETWFAQAHSYVMPYFRTPGLEAIMEIDLDRFKRNPNATGFMRPVFEGELEALQWPIGTSAKDFPSVRMPPEKEHQHITHVCLVKEESTEGDKKNTVLFKTYYTREYMRYYKKEHPMVDLRETIMFIPALPGQDINRVMIMETSTE